MEPLVPGNIGAKRNTECYMFSEPRAPVDAVWVRIRGSRFSILKAEADVDFWVNYARNAPFDPKMHFAHFPRFQPQQCFLPETHFWVQKRNSSKSIFYDFARVAPSMYSWNIPHRGGGGDNVPKRSPFGLQNVEK